MNLKKFVNMFHSFYSFLKGDDLLQNHSFHSQNKNDFFNEGDMVKYTNPETVIVERFEFYDENHELTTVTNVPESESLKTKANPEQTVSGKDKSNPLTADALLKSIIMDKLGPDPVIGKASKMVNESTNFKGSSIPHITVVVKKKLNPFIPVALDKSKMTDESTSPVANGTGKGTTNPLIPVALGKSKMTTLSKDKSVLQVIKKLKSSTLIEVIKESRIKYPKLMVERIFIKFRNQSASHQ